MEPNNTYKITPLQKDPKRQELRTHLRPRWIKDPEQFLKSNGSTVSVRKSILKSIGFIVSVRKSILKACVFLSRSEKVMKNRWFYRPSHRTCEYNIGFIDPATEHVNITLVL